MCFYSRLFFRVRSADRFVSQRLGNKNSVNHTHPGGSSATLSRQTNLRRRASNHQPNTSSRVGTSQSIQTPLRSQPIIYMAECRQSAFFLYQYERRHIGCHPPPRERRYFTNFGSCTILAEKSCVRSIPTLMNTASTSSNRDVISNNRVELDTESNWL